ncbi:MAG: NAD(P)H-binding protein [Acidobacteria bacterium]|nr:NAD(P)H-binding protein [Acidobacteriota bacterium]
MGPPQLNIVTGAFGYAGRYIAQRLLERGERVKTLTGHPLRPDPFNGRVLAVPFHFDRPAELTRSLEGASTLYNTYWVRFAYKQTTFDRAIQNTLALFQAARDAGVGRVVHVSITKAREDSPLPYFRGKAILERALRESGLSYAILRPAVLFGHDDILVNNIAWCLRTFPTFVIPGSGNYKVQPIHVEDLAEMAVHSGHERTDSVADAVGPETYSYEKLVRLMAQAIGSKSHIVHVAPALALALAKAIGLIVRDVLLTREEIDGLMAGLLASDGPPTAKTRFTDWLKQNANTLGRRYASELARHYQSG